MTEPSRDVGFLLQRAAGRCEAAGACVLNSLPSGLPNQDSPLAVSSDGGARYSAGDMIVSPKAAYAVN